MHLTWEYNSSSEAVDRAGCCDKFTQQLPINLKNTGKLLVVVLHVLESLSIVADTMVLACVFLPLLVDSWWILNSELSSMLLSDVPWMDHQFLYLWHLFQEYQYHSELMLALKIHGNKWQRCVLWINDSYLLLVWCIMWSWCWCIDLDVDTVSPIRLFWWTIKWCLGTFDKVVTVF